MNATAGDAAVRIADVHEAMRVAGLTRLMRLLLALGTRLRIGGALLELADGRRFVVGGEEPGPLAHIVVHDQRVARRLLFGGTVGFAESFLDGDWDSPDLTALLEMAARNEDVFNAQLLHGKPLARVLNRVVHALRSNSRRGSRRNIAYHYDLGNAFYERWLDTSMTYSSAIFAEGDDLAAAQRRKYARIAELGQFRAEHSVLEIGCGWGGFAEFAAREIGCRITAITISREQHEYASRRIAGAGLNERVDVRLVDYRDVEGRFDRIASIEMLEAVGERFWPVYFDRLQNRLAPGGVAALQVITIADRMFDAYRRGTDFIQRYVFPGGMLPSPEVLRAHTAQAGLVWRDDHGFGEDYARTLAAWRDRFLGAWDEIHPLGFDQRFQRLWRYYLAYCEAGFRSGTIDVKQIALQRG